MNWGFHIKRLREERHLTQEELSRGSGLTRSHIAQIERGVYVSVKEETLKRLAKGLGMAFESLISEIYGEVPRTLETPEEILDRLQLSMPITVPIYEEFSSHAREFIEITDSIAIIRERAKGRQLEGYIMHGKYLEPEIQEGDIIIINRAGRVEDGDIVAYLMEDKLCLGRLKEISGELYLVNNGGEIKMEEHHLAAPVIEVRRRIK